MQLQSKREDHHFESAVEFNNPDSLYNQFVNTMLVLLQNFQTQQLHRFASLLSALGNQTVDFVHTLNRGKIFFSGFSCTIIFWENYLVGLFIASLVSSIVFPSMFISALAPLDKNSLKRKISENPQRF